MHAPSSAYPAVIKRDGSLAGFDLGRIEAALMKAFVAVSFDPATADIPALLSHIEESIVKLGADKPVPLEAIQDIVERSLVERGWYELSKAYILYRAQRSREREGSLFASLAPGVRSVTKRNGQKENFEPLLVRESLERATRGLEKNVNLEELVKSAYRSLYDGIPSVEIAKNLVSSATGFIERDPAYDALAARLYRHGLEREVFGKNLSGPAREEAYRASFVTALRDGAAAKIYAPEVLRFDLNRLAAALKPERDELFDYQGIRTLGERYLIKNGETLLELPQSFWMRVALGLAIDETEKEKRALEFYEVMSSLRFVPSTPTLFHAALSRPQLSSCYVSYVGDDLAHIFKVLGDNAQLSKWSGGIGNDWTAIRALGAEIKSTRVQSQGVVPFLKICNDTTVAINRSGKRRGALCSYLETWHLDIEDFLDLRRNTGDERRRTHDMNTANWIPDLFMKRVRDGATWTLFSPEEVPDLHELYGAAFEERYVFYEREAAGGRIRLFKAVEAKTLWRKMLSRLFETGHPWITFKDSCNVRSPQDHAGVIHNSNLCTEITLNNSREETAVCNLGSVNLAKHTGPEGLDEPLLAATIGTAMRMLDNVIDINFYPTVEAEVSNKRHRPVGLGLMGFQDALFAQKLAFTDPAAAEFADYSAELFSYHAILASSELAAERGTYPSYAGSKWDRGIFPLNTLELLERERGESIRVDKSSRLDWTPVREHVARHGMRNSNTMALAPTATISTIAGCFPTIEPIYKNLYVKSNMSGEFTVVNTALVEELKALNLWSEGMLKKIKFHDGNLDPIEEIPVELKERFRESFAIDPILLLDFTARRGKWIDQSQSHNVFMKGSSGSLLESIYREAWERGLKTTYYLRTQAASQIEKSTLDSSFGFTQKRRDGAAAAPGTGLDSGAGTEPGRPGTSREGQSGSVPKPGSRTGAEAGGQSPAAGAKAGTGAKVFAAPLRIAAESADDLGVRACLADNPDCESCQ